MTIADEPTTSDYQSEPKKRTITVTSIITALTDLVKQPFDPHSFAFDILSIYRDTPKTTLAKLKNGGTNAAQDTGGVLLKKVLYFQPCAPGDDPATVAESLLHAKITERNDPRFLLVTNGEYVHIRDRKTADTCNRKWDEEQHWGHFLLPLNPKFGRTAEHEEHRADVNAATKLRRLYQAILKANPDWADGYHTRELNVLITRILFCLYAEDTDIFDTKKIFTDTVRKYSDVDGGDLAELLGRLFAVMNVEEGQRPAKLSPIESAFPYVNGNLFETALPIPRFDRLARRSLLECGEELNWAEINPDIFGSMIQTISDPTSRASIGMHYTSMPNIMKILRPLLLDNLEQDFNNAKTVSKLQALRARLANIRVFDPACGSGNFLIIAYKELRRIEMRALARIGELEPNEPLRLSNISLEHFYGVDIVDFACDVARLSLWIAEHQMNMEFLREFGKAKATLPLEKITTIKQGNSLRLDWACICPAAKETETYICGNPPYLGAPNQSADQKSDVALLFSHLTTLRTNLDYVTCFFLKAAEYIQTNPGAKCAFVSTNSICQGEQVAILWPLLYAKGADISFAYESFKWENRAANNAGVTCIIVGLASVSDETPKKLYHEDRVQTVSEIGPYLIPETRVIVNKSDVPINGLPDIIWGSQPLDEGNLILSPHERQQLLKAHPEAAELIRRYVGADDFINDVERYCIWIPDDRLALAESIPEIRDRIERVGKFRKASTAQTTRQYGNNPHRFRPNRFNPQQDAGAPALIVPIVSSERRRYLTVDVITGGAIINNLAFAVYNPPTWLMAILSSRMHRIWAVTVGGSLETRLRYSNQLVYNTFPLPELSSEQKRILATHSRSIRRAREAHPGSTIATLYNPDSMPGDLIQAHLDNDSYIEENIYGRRFANDTERMEMLFRMYDRFAKRAAGNDLFDGQEPR